MNMAQLPIAARKSRFMATKEETQPLNGIRFAALCDKGRLYVETDQKNTRLILCVASWYRIDTARALALFCVCRHRDI